jgi:hypothetical protein
MSQPIVPGGSRSSGIFEALNALAPIGLDELNGIAALQARVDRKYLLPATVATSLLQQLGGSARVLQVGGGRETRYASVYFDTPALDCFRGTAHRRRRRFKVRTRSYSDTGGSFLEVKTRTGRGLTVKNRTEHPVDAVNHLGGDGRRYVAAVLGAAGIDPATADALEPVLRTDYRRATLFLPVGNTRLTIDSGLRWRGSGRCCGQSCGLDDLVVVETKSPGAPGRADRLLWAAGIRPAPLSKYGTGMALLQPGLPSNRWHRVLHQQIRSAATPIRSRCDAADQGGSS